VSQLAFRSKELITESIEARREIVEDKQSASKRRRRKRKKNDNNNNEHRTW